MYAAYCVIIQLMPFVKFCKMQFQGPMFSASSTSLSVCGRKIEKGHPLPPTPEVRKLHVRIREQHKRPANITISDILWKIITEIYDITNIFDCYEKINLRILKLWTS